MNQLGHGHYKMKMIEDILKESMSKLSKAEVNVINDRARLLEIECTRSRLGVVWYHICQWFQRPLC